MKPIKYYWKRKWVFICHFTNYIALSFASPLEEYAENYADCGVSVYMRYFKTGKVWNFSYRVFGDVGYYHQLYYAKFCLLNDDNIRNAMLVTKDVVGQTVDEYIQYSYLYNPYANIFCSQDGTKSNRKLFSKLKHKFT